MSGWWIGAICCCLYYIYTLISFGFSSFSVIWLLAGLLLGAIGWMNKYHENWLRNLPVGLKVTGFVILSIIVIIFILVEAWIIRYSFSKPEAGADYCVVLGAQVNGEEASVSLRKRTLAAVAYLQENPKAIAIATGGIGSGEDITEAECIRRLMVDSGISKDRILVEDNSTNTKENIQFATDLVGKDHSFVIMTCNYHQCRAQMIAKKMGLKHVSGRSLFSDPTLWPNYYVREFFAMIKYFIAGDI